MRYLVLLMALLPAVTGLAQANTLRVKMTDGKTQDFYFRDRPVVTMNADAMRIATAAAAVELPVEKVQTFTYVDVEGAGVATIGRDAAYKVEDDRITVENAAGPMTIMVSNIAGQTMARQTVAAGGSATVDMSAYEPGVYVVSVNGESFKVLRK